MNNFKFRSFIIIVFMLIWCVFILERLAHFCIFSRDTYIELGKKIASREGVYPAMRGRILDREKLPLAWSERYFDLYMAGEPETDRRKKQIFNDIQPSLGSLVSIPKDDGVLIKRNLSPEQINYIQPFLKRYHELRIVPRIERRCIDYPEVKSLIGRTESKDAHTFGLSGLEFKYNDSLSGIDGEYSVMVDRHENWIRGTWKLVKDAVPGRDLLIDKSLEELRKQRK